MTQTVRQIAEGIVAREGGFVNDPDDPGGATKHGVTIGTMKALGIDVTKDGKVDKLVHRCAGCALGMDGEEKWPLQVQDYNMHFCKQACLDRDDKDPAKAIAALKIKN